MTMTKYTPEQGELLDHVALMPYADTEDDANGDIVLVAAGAGTGKSFMSRQIVEQEKPKTALYTAFNKAIVTEGIERFKGTNVICKTFHALAYQYAYAGKNIEDFTYTCIKENLSYGQKADIIKAIDDFYVSASTDANVFMVSRFGNKGKSKTHADLACKYMEKMVDGSISPTFNFLLKYFHLQLVEGSVKCKYDMVILDEINDVTPVFLEIFKLIDSPKKIGLGETHQAIYQFLNLANGFEELDGVPVLPLSQSFRCSEEIASRIQAFMRKEAVDEFTFVGTDEPVQNAKSLYCTMTNASIIYEINSRIAAGQSFNLLRKPADIFACPLALMAASSGKLPYQKKYKFLADEYEYYQEGNYSKGFFNYLLEHVEDTEVQNAVRLLMNFKRQGINLYDVYKNSKSAKVDERYTIATVYTSKGLEFESVYIADDMNRAVQNIRDNGGIQSEEDLVIYRCYYVACSRCSVNLHNAEMLNMY